MAVFDANVLVALIVDLPWSGAARDAITDHEERIAPSILVAEVGNALWRNVRAHVLKTAQAAEGLSHARSLVTLVQDTDIVGGALKLAIEYDHPIYDCLYVALAAAENAALVTADRRLAGLAEAIDVEATLIAP